MLNSGKYFDRITESLNIVRQELISRSKLGLTDLNKFCEDFVRDIFNITYGYNLKNLNNPVSNYPGLDLGDVERGIAYQVTAIKTSNRVDEMIEQCIKENHFRTFKTINFFVLTSKQKHYTLSKSSHTYFDFSPEKNIIDFDDVYRDIQSLDTDRKLQLANYIEAEMPSFLSVTRGFSETELNVSLAKYLNKITKSKTISLLDSRYVDIYGQGDLELDAIGVEILDDEFQQFHNVYNFFEDPGSADHDGQEYKEDLDVSDMPEPEAKAKEPRVDTIFNISQDTQRFIIIGAPGSGKTTTLRKVQYQNCKTALRDNLNTQIPVFIVASMYGKPGMENLKIMIAEELQVPRPQVQKLLEKGRIQLLLDGMNEVDIKLKNFFEDEIRNIISTYDDVSVIISSRKYNFKNIYNIPLFELKELQDSEIKEFIYKHNQTKSQEIWNELRSNHQIMRLAYNPLMLFMIVGASRSGQIPKSKGELFDFFVNNILEVEFRKVISSGKDASVFAAYKEKRLDILSFLAFQLKLQGKVSVAGEVARSLISGRFDYLVYFELLDSPLLTGTTTVSFFHEMFLDYFCALAFKRKFDQSGTEPFSLREFGINDINENRWYEPLLMCGDLFGKKDSSGESAEKYVELLMRKEINVAKPQRKLAVSNYDLQDEKHVFELHESLQFTKEDFDENLLIAAKVAYQLRVLYPGIYQRVEKTLSNYLTVWSLNYRASSNLFSLPKLFAAIAALSSTRLLNKIFFDLKWREIWLYTPDYDSEEQDIPNMSLPAEDSLDLQQALVSHISNFDALFEILNNEDELLRYVFTIPIRERVHRIKNMLLASSNLNDLKRSYASKNTNIELLNYIGQIDIDFFIDHYDIEAWGSERLINQLLKNLNAKRARSLIIDMVQELDMSTQLEKDVIIAFFSGPFYAELYPFLEEQLSAKGPLRHLIIEKIKGVRFSTLSNGLRQYVKPKAIDYEPNVVKCKYIAIKKNVLDTRFQLQVPDITLSVFTWLRSREAISINGTQDCRIEAVGLRHAVLKKEISWKKIKSDADLAEIACYVVARPLTGTSLPDVPDEGVIKSVNMPMLDYIDLKIFENTHPDLLLENKLFMNELHQKLSLSNNSKYVEMVRNFGWIHKFHQFIPSTRYGLVVRKYNALATIGIIGQSHFISRDNPDDYFQIGDVCVFEKNNTFVLLDDQNDRSEKIGYIHSTVARVDYDKKEGHIFKRNKREDEKDFYFHFSDCDQTLSAGDYVSFIPGSNLALSSLGLPKAYKIQREKEVDKCEILTVNYNSVKKVLWGKCADLQTKESFIYTHFLEFRGMNQGRNIKIGQVYSYRLHVYHEGQEQKVRLLDIQQEERG